jgi:hypothetical protein
MTCRVFGGNFGDSLIMELAREVFEKLDGTCLQ